MDPSSSASQSPLPSPVAPAEERYRRLPGRHLSVGLGERATSLHLGSDHLLLVGYDGFSEAYKRFRFADIQAIVVRKTNRRAVFNAVLWAVGAILFGWTSLLVSGAGDGMAWGLVVASPFLLAGLVNTMLGPGCTCHLRTAVQIEELRSLRRLRNAENFLATIEPLVVEAQGGPLTYERLARVEFAGFPGVTVSAPGAPPAGRGNVDAREGAE